MPKKEIDSSKSLLYKIVCKDLAINDLYVGNTTNFIKRKSRHKRCANDTELKEHNIPLYQFINKNGGWENWEMIEIEKYPCNDANEARARERYWKEQLHATLNVRVPSRTRKEWKQSKWHCELCNCDFRQHYKWEHERTKSHLSKIIN